jgi:hypothetical protein
MNGWKPLPLSLKILSIVLLLWVLMSISVVVAMPEREIALFGLLLQGAPATTVVLLLDIISPLIFIYSAWKKLKWGANFGMLYNAVFNVNCIVSLFLFRDLFGNGIYFPLIASAIFLFIIYKERNYFST